MAAAFKYPHVEKVEGQSARLERTPRIRVAQIVMDYLEHGWSVDEMCHQHPYLSLTEASWATTEFRDTIQIEQINQFLNGFVIPRCLILCSCGVCWSRCAAFLVPRVL